MQVTVDTFNPKSIWRSPERSAVRERNKTRVTLQNVTAGTSLYRAGDRRHLYRVEAGALCNSMQWPDGRLEVIESAFPGEIVGLGNLETHVSSANALSDTMVSIVDESEFAREMHSDGVLSLRFAAAAEREFDYLRERAKHAPKRPPVALVANYLLAVASMNERQNKAADFISDEHCNQIIVEMLQLDMKTMSHSLLLLQRLGLIAAAPGGLRLLNVSSMEFLADAV